MSSLTSVNKIEGTLNVETLQLRCDFFTVYHSFLPFSPSSFLTRSISDSCTKQTGMYQSSPASVEHRRPVVCTCSAPSNGHQHCCPARQYQGGSPNSVSPSEIAQRTPSNPVAPQAFVFVDPQGSYPAKPQSPPKRQEPMQFRMSTPSHPLVSPRSIPTFIGTNVLHAPFHCAHAHPMHPIRLSAPASLNTNELQPLFDTSFFNNHDDLR